MRIYTNFNPNHRWNAEVGNGIHVISLLICSTWASSGSYRGLQQDRVVVQLAGVAKACGGKVSRGLHMPRVFHTTYT